MTGKQLIEYIEKWKLEDCQIEVQYRDEGGLYFGTDSYIEPFICEPGQKCKYAGVSEHKRLIL